jgi:hypothetical protein
MERTNMAEYLYLRVSEETKKLLLKVSRERVPFRPMARVAEDYLLQGIERDLAGDDRVQRMLAKVRA